MQPAHCGNRRPVRTAMIATPDGSRAAAAEAEGSPNAPEALGATVAERLKAQGAEAILALCKAQADAASA